MKKKTVTFLVALCLSIQPIALAHSGGTNSDGCHNVSSNGTYHCHGESDDYKWGRILAVLGISIGVILILSWYSNKQGTFKVSDLEATENGVMFVPPDTGGWDVHSSFKQELDGETTTHIEFVKEF